MFTGCTPRVGALAMMAVLMAGDGAAPAWGQKLSDSPDEYQRQIQAAKAKAVAYLYSRQRTSVRVVRIEDQKMIVEESGEAAISVTGNTARVGSKSYANVFAVLPSGWFEPDPLGDVDWANAGGSTALVTLALLEAGETPDKEPRLERAIRCLEGLYCCDMGGQVLKDVKGRKLVGGLQGTYGVALMVCIYERLMTTTSNPTKKSAHRRALIAYQKRIETGFRPDGGYDYLLRGSDRWDMSNTQYAMLALWAAHNATREVSEKALTHLNNFYLKVQNSDGSFPYAEGKETNANMTAGAVASLMILMDSLHTSRDRPEPDPYPPTSLPGRTIKAAYKGLEWFASNYKAAADGYLLYSTERIGSASGFKRFGIGEWYRDGVEVLLRTQAADGHWPPAKALGYTVEETLNTAFCLLFIAHGSGPVLLNKLRWGPPESAAWNHYPRDAAGLTRWFNRSFEQNAAWQVVDTDAPHDWNDAPILLITGATAPEFDETILDNLRDYIAGGGTLLLAACGNAKTTRVFVEAARSLAVRLYGPTDYPDHQLRPVTPDHPLYAVRTASDALKRLKLSHVHNGSRSVLFLIHDDVAFAWNNGRDAKRDEMFSVFNHIKLYVTDKALVLPPRLKPRPPEVADPDALPSLHVAAIEYTSTGKVTIIGEDNKPQTLETTGDWNCASAGWRALNPYIMARHGLRIDDRRPVKLDDPQLRGYAVLHLAGRQGLSLSPQDKTGLRQFVEYQGGVIFIEDCGLGSRRLFRDAMVEHLKAIFPDGQLKNLPDEHPVMAGLPGSPGPVKAADYSRAVKLAKPKLETVDLQGFYVKGRVAAVLSEYDLSNGLAGSVYYDRWGFQNETARHIATNLLLWVKAERAKGGK